MALSLEQIRDEVRNPQKRTDILAAIAQQDIIKFHADTNLDIAKGAPYEKFRLFVASILPKDKFLMTMNLLKFPIPTNEVTESIFTRLSKIFDGRNPAFNYQFHNTQERDDWEWYRQDILGEPRVWSTKAWDYFKTEINCVMVVDMPLESDPTDRYPQPYFYFVPIEYVISYSVNERTGNMNWIIYRYKDRIIAIDDEAYYSMPVDKSGIPLDDITTNPHGLGYCPSRFFWNESLSLKRPDIKKSPLSKALSDLNWYLFFTLAKRHFDLYGAYPILSGFHEDCDYSDAQGNTCDHGHLKDANGHWVTDINGNIKECPLCHNKKDLAGPGSYIEVPIPEEGQPDLRNPVQMLKVDRSSLDYNVDEVERLRKHIITSCVGMDNTILNETSLADKQVDATYDSQEVVLMRIKQGMEEAQQWVDSTICRLRYGTAFMSAKINYGTEFYTLTPEVLQKRYTDAKEGGASEGELDALKDQLIETEFRHNPNMLQRMLILSNIEPFRHLSSSEVDDMFSKGLVSKEEYLLKKDFSGFIRKFERENDNIIEFGSALDFKEKIRRIQEILLAYARERIGETNS